MSQDLVINAPKLNGFSRPLNHLQNISFHTIYGSQHGTVFIILNAVHFALSLAMFVSAYCATTANVVDPFIIERGFPTPVMPIKAFQKKYYSSLQNKELCWCKHCNWYVHRNAKHCRACNRCTDNFDHHCRWLNNCISSQNYQSFVAAIVSTELMLLYEIAIGVLLLIGKIDTNAHLFIPTASPVLIYSLITLHIMIAGFMAIPNGQLIIFHLYLNQKQITTYEWVLKREEEKELKEEQKKKQQQLKRESITNAILKQNGDKQETQKKIKSQILRSICCGCKSYIHSFRDCNEPKLQFPRSKGPNRQLTLPSNFSQDVVEYANSTKSSKSGNSLLSVDTNVEVKLSGLSTNGSTDELDISHITGTGPIILEEATPPSAWRLCCVSLYKCSRRPFRKRNRVQPPLDRHKRYSNETEDDHINDIETEDVIFGPDNAQLNQQEPVSVPLEEVTDENV